MSREIPYHIAVGELRVGFTLRNGDGTRPQVTDILDSQDALGEKFRVFTLSDGTVDAAPNSTLITIVSDN